MGPIVYPNAGLQKIANILLAYGLVWRLFTNNYVVDKTAVWSSFVEPTVSGYAPQAVGAWTTQINILGHQLSTAADVVFTNSDPSIDVTCYGYFVTDGAMTPDVFEAANFDSPLVLVHGKTLNVTPFLGGFSANPPQT